MEMQALPEAPEAPESGPEAERLCFVCMEPCEYESKCKCKGRYVHPACLLQWLQTKRSTRCDVCLETYPNVQLTTKIYRHPSYACWGSIAASIFFVAMIVVGSFLLSLYLGTDPFGAGTEVSAIATLKLALGVMVVGVSIVGLAMSLACGMQRRRDGCRPWHTRRQILVVMDAA